MDNTYGSAFRIHTFGESHGQAIGVVVDGCPAGVRIDEDFIQQELDRRRPGQSAIVTQRKEADRAEILSGIFEGYSTGTPIALLIRNADAKSQDYDHLRQVFRPSHADYTYYARFGRRDHRGGGRSSARETAARVAGGAIAKLLLTQCTTIRMAAWVHSVGSLSMPELEAMPEPAAIEANPVRCPDAGAAIAMEALIREVRKAGDTIGGIVAGRITGMPPGLGAPVFDRLHADLGKAMLSINAAKGFEYGSGFAGTHLRGSQHNDPFYTEKTSGRIRTQTNHSGGIQGGISNGEDVYFKVAFKPVATLLQEQPTVDRDGQATVVQGKGRHDPCVLPRAVPIVEAMAALTLADHWLRARTSIVDA
ncbi:MAG: chorismate synthase [Bacteroidetes bacterium]|nr:chorismate synthase [Bacteroidota bacterium]